MGFYNIYVSKNAHISVKNNQLLLQTENKTADFPLEDINSVMIENLNTNISVYALSALSNGSILTFICDKNHLPCGVVLPFCKHYQTLSQVESQINMSKPLQKQLWAKIIKNKIGNQNEVLNICGESDVLKNLQKSVLSGDSGNNEAKASLIYFKKLFGKNFVRKEESVVNACLNYGYSIIRGFVARSIVAHGFMPAMGIFHCNQFNQFNLADDLMEVFRPIIDLYVKVYLQDVKELTPTVKADIYSIINYDVLIDGQVQPLGYAIELFVQNFVKCVKEGVGHIKIVELCGLSKHRYE